MMDDLLKVGGPAFPSTNDLGEGTTSSFMGMTLRDYFAGQALTGLLSRMHGVDLTGVSDAFTDACYGWADMMLEARNKP